PAHVYLQSNIMPTSSYANDDARWQAMQARDPEADDAFVYAVRTTGIYGRPSCCVRLPKRENVEFFPDEAAAQAAGYRPSHRLGIDRSASAIRRGALVALACRLIETSDTPPSLDELARQAGMSPFHFHRLFKAETGLTPKSYGDAQRARKLRGSLADAPSVTQAVYDAGFNSSSRFYEHSSKLLGMPPGRYRSGGEQTQIRFAVAQCSLGALLVAQSERG